jgi:hypothetical protein
LGIWRRLKRLGAVALHDAVWALPLTGETKEGAEWIAEEVEERGGAALIWEASSLTAEQDEVLIRLFRHQADRGYGSIMEAAKSLRRSLGRGRAHRERLDQALRQIARLERLYRLQRRRDFFRAPNREPTEAILSEVREEIRTRVSTEGGEKRHVVGH